MQAGGEPQGRHQAAWPGPTRARSLLVPRWPHLHEDPACGWRERCWGRAGHVRGARGSRPGFRLGSCPLECGGRWTAEAELTAETSRQPPCPALESQAETQQEVPRAVPEWRHVGRPCVSQMTFIREQGWLFNLLLGQGRLPRSAESAGTAAPAGVLRRSQAQACEFTSRFSLHR